MSREGHKTRTCGRREPQVRILIWLLIGLDGTCKSSLARWPEENACLLLGEGAVIILQELSQFFHIKTPFLFEMNGGNETSEILGESLIIHPQHLSEFVPNVPFHESRPPISFVSCGFCFGIFVFPFDGLIIAPVQRKRKYILHCVYHIFSI